MKTMRRRARIVRKSLDEAVSAWNKKYPSALHPAQLAWDESAEYIRDNGVTCFAQRLGRLTWSGEEYGISITEGADDNPETIAIWCNIAPEEAVFLSETAFVFELLTRLGRVSPIIEKCGPEDDPYLIVGYMMSFPGNHVTAGVLEWAMSDLSGAFAAAADAHESLRSKLDDLPGRLTTEDIGNGRLRVDENLDVSQGDQDMTRFAIPCPYGQGEVVIDTENRTVSPTPTLVMLDAFDTASYNHQDLHAGEDYDSCQAIYDYGDGLLKVSTGGTLIHLRSVPAVEAADREIGRQCDWYSQEHDGDEVPDDMQEKRSSVNDVFNGRALFAPDPVAFCEALREAATADVK